MNERPNFWKIALAAFLACLIGLLAIDVGAITLEVATSGFYVGQIAIFLGVLLIGGFFAIFTALPLGCAIGWLLVRAGPASPARAAVAGALTGAIWPIVFRATLSWPPEFDLEGIGIFGIFMFSGSVSGYLAYRVVLGGARGTRGG